MGSIALQIDESLSVSFDITSLSVNTFIDYISSTYQFYELVIVMSVIRSRSPLNFLH